MDEVRIRTRFMKSIIEKLAKRVIKKNIKKNIDIHIEELEAQFAGEFVTLKINTEVTISKQEFEAMLLGDEGS